MIYYEETEYANATIVKCIAMTGPGYLYHSDDIVPSYNNYYGSIVETKKAGWFEVGIFCVTDRQHNIIGNPVFPFMVRRDPKDNRLYGKYNGVSYCFDIPNYIPENVNVELENIIWQH